MSFPAHYLPAVLLTILSLPISLWAQAAPKQTARTARGSISGRVTIKEKGVAGVVVALQKNESRSPYERFPRATTDQDGYYRIANVEPGTYELSPSAPALVPADARDPKSRQVLVSEDEDVENINFTLVRGGVITGRVTDADERPVIQQQVYIFRSDAFQPQDSPQPRPAFATASVQTDDRGIYRVFGLLPGRYKVAVGRSDDAFTPSFGPARSAYKQVFHPAVSDQAKATVIEVGEGTEAANVDITLGRTLQTFSVAGRVVDEEKGLPAPNIRLVLQRRVGQGVEFMNTVTVSNARGDFVAEGLIPGKYAILMFSNENSSSKRVESLTFDVFDQDLSGITVKLISGASLSGLVVLETENKTGLMKLAEAQLQAYVMNPGGTGGGIGSSATSKIAADGSFQLGGLPAGLAQIRLSSTVNPYPPKGFNLVRVERDGVAAPRGIEIKDGEQLTGIRVVVAYGTATLHGVVTVENGTLPSGARIFVGLMKPGEHNTNMRPPPVDSRGHFVIEGIPAGPYEVYASLGGVPRNAFRQVKREVNLQDGVVTDITLTIDMSAPQKP